MKLNLPSYSLLAALALSAPTLHAATIFTAISATSTSNNFSDRTILKAIDGSGLSSGGTSGDILSETHDHSGGGTSYFLDTKTAVLTFDLGAIQTVDTVYIWNYARTSEDDRAITGFNISFSDDGVTYTTAETVTGFLAVPYTGATQEVAVQDVSFTSGSGRYIKIEEMANGGDTYAGFGEIRFGAVPEPAAAMLVGIGGLLLLLRRRRD